MPSSRARVLELIDAAFPPGGHCCAMTLTQGEALDNYETPVKEALPTDWRSVSDADLETDLYGVVYLDEETKRFYRPAFLAYAVRRTRPSNMTTYHCFHNFLNPSPLEPLQREAVLAALEFLAFDEAWETRDSEALFVLRAWEKYPAP